MGEECECSGKVVGEIGSEACSKDGYEDDCEASSAYRSEACDKSSHENHERVCRHPQDL